MSKLNLKKFEKNLIVRPLKVTDWESVVALQKTCFPNMDTWTKEQFESQIAIFSEGQIGIEYQGKLVASSSSLILDFELYKEWHSFDEIADHGFIRNHRPDASTLYGIELMVDPAYRGLKLARRLYDARKRLAREKNLMRIVVGGRIPSYYKHSNLMSAHEYVDKVMTKTLFDPVLTVQLSNDFVLKRIIPIYFTTDVDSKGFSAFVEWTYLDYVPGHRQRFVPITPVRVCVVQYQMRMVRNFEAFAEQCEYFADVAAGYKCDFMLFPEMFTTQLLSMVHGRTCLRRDAQAVGFSPIVTWSSLPVSP